MILLQHAANLNNEGVRLLMEENQTMASIQVLQQALAVMEQWVVPTIGVVSSATTHGNAVPFELSMFYTPSPVQEDPSLPTGAGCCYLPPFIQQSPIRPNSPIDEQYFVYDRPFYISPHRLACETAVECSDAMDLIRCHILFNCGLVWHHHARTTGSEQAMRLAGQWYEKIVSGLTSGYGQYYDLSFAALTCLTFNNRAQLHYELLEFIESVLCVDVIRTLLGTLNGLKNYLLESERSHMVWNTEHFRPPIISSAA